MMRVNDESMMRLSVRDWLTALTLQDIPIVPTISGTITFDQINMLQGHEDQLADDFFTVPADYTVVPPWIYAANHIPMRGKAPVCCCCKCIRTLHAVPDL
jgi:hypothetical protein